MNKILIQILTVFCLTDHVLAMESIPYRFQGWIGEGRKSATAEIHNHTNADAICEKLRIRIEFYNDNFNESIGYTDLQTDPVYILAGGSTAVPVLADAGSVSGPAGAKYIGRLTLDGVDSCRSASYSDYCHFADKDEAETEALEILGRHFNSHPCEIPVTTVTQLALRNKGLRSVKALSFMTQLQKLDLQGNQISSVRDLTTLMRLKRINLDLNPVSDLLPLVDLPEIQLIRARETKVKIPMVNNSNKGNPIIDLVGPGGSCSIRIKERGRYRRILCQK
jgi:hypothetical protein